MKCNMDFTLHNDKIERHIIFIWKDDFSQFLDWKQVKSLMQLS